MFKYFILLLVLLFAFPVFGAEKDDGVLSRQNTEASFNAAYDAADQARKKAASLGHEWRDTRKLLKKAKAAAKKGNYDEAVMLADEAKFEGEMATEQAMLQDKLWQEAVPKLQQ